MLNMQDLLMLMVQKTASDLHITAGTCPMLRIDGELVQTEYEKLTPDHCQRLIYSLLTDSQKEKFEASNELDLSFGIKGVGRVRMNVYRQRGSVGAALRSIPQKIMTFEELRLPPVVHEIMRLQKGLVLVTGPTGAGKSTTLASLINYLNENRAGHIMTIEDPIEYVHLHKKSIVNQREIGSDSFNYESALKFVLRQDPDVILLGEMRDLVTISSALTLAETGHLVFATLHTTDAASSINRIIDVFPPHQQAQIRSQLSMVLQAVFAQQLLPHASGVGRVLACEVLIMTPGIRNMIREMKIEQIHLAMQTGGSVGMQTMNQSLFDLYTRREIPYQIALDASTDVNEMKRSMQKVTA
ncbi:MAG: type IV pilus twitching motility protein PilT [Endomicrobiales bacterium]